MHIFQSGMADRLKTLLSGMIDRKGIHFNLDWQITQVELFCDLYEAHNYGKPLRFYSLYFL